MDEINVGRYWSKEINGQHIAVGIRTELEKLSKVLPVEAIFVAITGRSGDYRAKDDVDRILESLGLEIAYKHDTKDEGLADCLLYDDIKTHRSVFDGLVQYVDTVYPLPEREESDEVEEVSEAERGEDSPF